MIFDTHIHLNDKKILNNLDQYINDALSKGVKKFLCVGWDIESSKKAIEIAHKYKDIVFAAVGIIPTEHLQFNDNSINELRELAKDRVVRAIGEIGLDYYWEKEEKVKEKQKDMFIKQIELANELNLPISVHSREAIKDTFDILNYFHVKRKSVLHCYSGSLEMAREFMKINFVFGFGGTLTYKNSVNVKKTIQNIGLEHILFETDAPYLPPQNHRGKLNEPSYICETVRYVSEFLNIDLNKLEDITFKNSEKIFSRENYETKNS